VPAPGLEQKAGRPPLGGNLQSFRQAEHQTFNNTSAKQLHNSRRKETETPRNGSRNPLAFREPELTLKAVEHTFSQKNPIHTITNFLNQQQRHHVALHCLHAAFGQGKYDLGDQCVDGT
jgi:hypothetical protein